jgi:hypothetical protein
LPTTVPEGVDPATATEVEWWISHTTGRLRAGRSLPLEGEDEMGADAPQSVKYEGKLYPMAPLPFVVRHPIFGAQITAIALVWELSPQGQWERVAARGTRIGFPHMDYCDDVDCGGHNVIRERVRFRDGLYALAEAHDPQFGVLDPARVAAAAECDVSGRCRPDDMNLDEKTRVLFEITSISDHDMVGARVALCRVPPRLRHRAFNESKCAGSGRARAGLCRRGRPPSSDPDPTGSWLTAGTPAGRCWSPRADCKRIVVGTWHGKLAAWLPWRELWELAR